jgi:hypothetical protein
MIVIKTYSDRLTAVMAQGQLAASGVIALVHTDNGGGMRPDLDLTLGVQLLVPLDAAEVALQILDAPDEDAGGPAWKCGFCGESNEPQFDACWQCGQQRA